MFGNDNNSSSYKKKNYFKITDQEQVFGFFGPLYGARNNAYFYKVHFGYKNSKGKFRPFQSTLRINKETKEVETPDAALTQLNHLTEQLEKAKKEKNQPAIERLSTLVGMKGVYNLDKNWHFNVHTMDGRIGTLALRHRAGMILDSKIEEWKKAGIDVFSAEDGRFISVRRIGTGPDTSYDIQLYRQQEDIGGGRKAQVDVVRTITPALANKAGGFVTAYDGEGKELYAEGDAADLTKLFQKITPEEIALIVEKADLRTGNSPACDLIFDERWKTERDAKKGAKPVAKVATSVITPAATVAPAVNPDDEEPSDDTMSLGGSFSSPAPTPAAKTQVAQEAKAAVSTPVAPAPTSAAVFEEMNDDDFFKQVGLPKRG